MVWLTEKVTMTEKYLENVIEVLAERTGLRLTPDQAQEIVDETGPFHAEILEGSCWDTAPREVLVSELCKKLTGRASWTNSEIWNDREGYNKWLTDFVRGALAQGYSTVED